MTTDVGRVAVVTGGAGGLGRAITARLRADGFRVAIADLDPGPADQTRDPGLLAVPVDVTDPGSAAAMRDQVLGHWGRIDVLVNNAGIAGPTSPVADYPPDAWQRVIAVNLTGVFHCTRAVRVLGVQSRGDRVHEVGRQGGSADRRSGELRRAGRPRRGPDR